MSVRIHIYRNDWRPLSLVQKDILQEMLEESGLSGREDRRIPFDEKHASEYDVRVKDMPLMYPLNLHLVKKRVEEFNQRVNKYPGGGYRLYSSIIEQKPA
jgi:hypothetical protein